MIKSAKKLIVGIPVIGPALKAVYNFNRKRVDFKQSSQYWEDRYKIGGNSGAGSYGRLAEFKAEYLNKFVHDHSIKSVVEFGCGDGAQLALAQYPSYCGYDVAKTAVEVCQKKFRQDPTKVFRLLSDLNSDSFELAISLDVIYHLVEDHVFEAHMQNIFAASNKYVIIYASNKDEQQPAKHVRHRQFSKWIETNKKNWTLLEMTKNRFPFDVENPDQSSFADFYVYKRNS